MIKKKKILVTIIMMMTLLLTGCDVNDVLDDYKSIIIEEGERNIKCTEKLVSMGIMSKGSGDTLIKNINKTVDKYTSVTDIGDFAGESKKSVEYVMTKEELEDIYHEEYLEYYNSAYEKDGETHFRLSKPSFKKLENLIEVSKVNITKYETWKSTGKLEVNIKNANSPTISSRNVKEKDRISFLSMDDNDVKYFESLTAIPVYVLKSSSYNGGDKDGDIDWYKQKYIDSSYTEYASIDNLIKIVDELKNGQNVVNNENELEEYFSDSGAKLRAETDLIVHSTLKFKSDGYHSLTLATVSFNQKDIEELYGSMESIEGKYFIYNKKAYLLEYPVYSVNNLVATVDGGDEWTTDLKETGMKVNFFSGEMADKNGKLLKQKDDTDTFYHVDKSTGTSSFMFGTELLKYTGIGYNNKSVDGCLQIVLKDYMEYIYLPDVIDKESFVGLGRRIRVDNLWGNTGTRFGHFIDKKGNKTGSMELLASNLIGLNSGKKMGSALDLANTKVVLALKYKSSGNTVAGDSTSDSGLIEADAELLLNKYYVPSLRISYPFGETGAEVGTIDISNSAKSGPVIYGMATDISLFDSSLYAEWVNVNGDGGDVGSLGWWNKWLKSNGYKYQIDLNKLSTSLGEKYSYELAEEGQIILDLVTIGKIQKEYNRDAEISKVTGVRTAFIVLGTLIMAYSILILCAWVVDVNITNGPKLLTKLSLGHWVAVISTDEIPNMNTGETQYYNFNSVLLRSMIICAVGVMLYLVDFVVIVGMVWGLFENLAKLVSEKIFNIF